MAIKVKARGGETVEQMVRRFKKLCEKEGLTKEVKRRQYYEKPSETKRRNNARRSARPMLMGAAGARGARGARAGSSGGRSGGGRGASRGF